MYASPERLPRLISDIIAGKVSFAGVGHPKPPKPWQFGPEEPERGTQSEVSITDRLNKKKLRGG